MRPATRDHRHPFQRSAALAPVVAAAWLLSGCQTVALPAAPIEGVVPHQGNVQGASDRVSIASTGGSSLINEGGPVFNSGAGTGSGSLINEGGPVFNSGAGTGTGSLINEGGPVFATGAQFSILGLVVTPRYFRGAPPQPVITAERLGGVAYPEVKASVVKPDGHFVLQGPNTDRYFFASASFSYEDSTHTARALAKADGTSPITLDTASTMVAAKVSLAEARHHLQTIDYEDTQGLSGLVRQKLGDKLADIQLDASAQTLSLALDALSTQDVELEQRLARWQFTLDSANSASPAPRSPGPVPTPALTDPPVK